jgi:anti-sigma-K factor RskA
MTDHQQWDELAAGYALHALSPDEEVVFADHLESCERCRASVDEHALTAAQLGALAHSQDADTPPSWEAIRSAVIPTTAPVIDLSQRRQRRYELSRRSLAAAAAVAVLAAGGVATWRLTGGSSSPAKPGSCQTAGCHVVALRTPQGRTSTGSAVINADGAVTVTPTGLTNARKGRTYVLWQVPRDGRPKAISVFKRGGKAGTAHGTISVAYSDLLELAISSEPANALPSRPSTLVAVGVTT